MGEDEAIRSALTGAQEIARFEQRVAPSAWLSAHVGETQASAACLGLAALLLTSDAAVDYARVHASRGGRDAGEGLLEISRLRAVVDSTLGARLASRTPLEPAAFMDSLNQSILEAAFV